MNNQEPDNRNDNDQPEAPAGNAPGNRSRLDFKKKSTWLLLVITPIAVAAMLAPIFTRLPTAPDTVMTSPESDTADEHATVLVPNVDIEVQPKRDAEDEAARFEDNTGTDDPFTPPEPPDEEPGTEEPDQADDANPLGYLDGIMARRAQEAGETAPANRGDPSLLSEEDLRWQEELKARKKAPAVMITYQDEAREARAGTPADDGAFADDDNVEELTPTPAGTGPTASWGRKQHGDTQSLNLNGRETHQAAFTPAAYRPDLDYRLLQGTTIALTLETAINSNLPGTVRAVVNQPVYASSGENLLIPARSRLLGEYATARVGDRRLFIIWQRLITPQGIEIFLDSPTAGPLGEAGARGKLNRRFFERFGAAMIFSLIAELAKQDNGGTSFTVQSASRSAADIALESSIGLAPIIQIKPGTQLTAQTARDLNFRDALNAYREHTTPFRAIPLVEIGQSLRPSQAELWLNELGLPGDAGDVLLAASEIAGDAAGTAADTDTAERKQAPTPVYLIPKRLLVDDSAPPAPPSLPAPCGFIHLKRSEYLSWQIDKWIDNCLKKPMEWAVGGYREWKDFIIEHDRYVPLPAGVTSLKTLLAEHWRIHLNETETNVIIHERDTRHD